MALSNISGFPRIGRNRELKFATEGYWRGEKSAEDLAQTAKAIRRENWELMQKAGIDLIPSNDFSYYDQMLDTIALLGAVPERYGWDGGEVRPRHLLRNGARPADRRPRRHRDGDDQMVQHELPLHRPRARARYEVRAVVVQAVRRARRGDGGAGHRHRSGPDRPGQLPAALEAGGRGL